MKKQSIYLVALAVVLVIVAIYLSFSKGGGTLDLDPKAFAIEDTASVDKIFIAEKTGKTITLTKKDNVWYAEGNVKVVPALAQLLLKTLHTIEIKNPLPEAARENVMRDMASSAKKVEVYQKGKLTNTYYIGGTTQDELGTLMMRKKDQVPYVTHLPGFNGYFSLRFFVDLEEWRDKTIFETTPDNLALIEVIYPKNPKASFRLEVVDDEFIRLNNFAGDSADSDVNPEFLRKTVLDFCKFSYEGMDLSMTQDRKEYVLAQDVQVIIHVADRNGVDKELKIYAKPVVIDGKMERSVGGDILIDVDTRYALINESSFVVIQNYQFNKFFISYQDFFKETLGQ